MQNEIMDDVNNSDTVKAYLYLLQWEWPEHIESILHKLIFARLNEIDADESEGGKELFNSDYLGARLFWLICVYPETSPALLHTLAQQLPNAYLERIAENPATLPATLELLSAHPSIAVRVAVAQNSKTAAPLLSKLVHDISVDVRYALAENVNVAESILTSLVDDDNAYVVARAQLSLNRLSPAEPAILPLRRQATASSDFARRRAARG
jgi:hypothetical protein